MRKAFCLAREDEVLRGRSTGLRTQADDGHCYCQYQPPSRKSDTSGTRGQALQPAPAEKRDPYERRRPEETTLYRLQGGGVASYGGSATLTRVRASLIATNAGTDVAQAPSDALAALIDNVQALVQAGDLSASHGQALINKLESALNQLEKDNLQAVINKLQAFIEQVSNLITDGFLTEAEGQPLIDAAEAVLAALSA